MKLPFLLVVICSLAMLCGFSAYNSVSPAPTLSPGESYNVFNSERPLSATYSQQLYIANSSLQPNVSISVELSWPSNPGAFNYQIQDSDTDTTDAYQTIPTSGTVTSAVVGPSGAYYARVELSPFRGRYVRIYVNTQTANVVSGTVKVTR
jgi:hypothetical protein